MAAITARIPARWHGGRQNTITRIVMHSTVTPCKPGWARKVAEMFHTSDRVASAHFVIDPEEVIRCLPNHTVGYGAPPNLGSIHVELCDWSKGPKSRWSGSNHDAMLRLAADRVEKLTHQYGLPLEHVGPVGLRAGEKGVCGHIDVTRAWHQTTHTDPDDFPWHRFLAMVREERAKRDASSDTGDGGGTVHPRPPVHLDPDADGDDGDDWTEHMVRNAPLIERGSDKKKWVRTAQALCGARHHPTPVDGVYGPGAENAVRAVQHDHGITVDGVVGQHTWAVLFTGHDL